MPKWNEKMLNLFTEETGKTPTYRVSGVVHHTLEYVNWLEERASKSEVAAHSTSDNTSMDAIALVKEALSHLEKASDEPPVMAAREILNAVLAQQHHS